SFCGVASACPGLNLRISTYSGVDTGATQLSAADFNGTGLGENAGISSATAGSTYTVVVAPASSNSGQGSGVVSVAAFNGAVSGGGSFNRFASATSGTCADLVAGTGAGPTSLPGTYSASQTCAAANPGGAIVGRCTVPFVDGGPATYVYYANSAAPWTAAQ